MLAQQRSSGSERLLDIQKEVSFLFGHWKGLELLLATYDGPRLRGEGATRTELEPGIQAPLRAMAWKLADSWQTAPLQRIFPAGTTTGFCWIIRLRALSSVVRATGS